MVMPATIAIKATKVMRCDGGDDCVTDAADDDDDDVVAAVVADMSVIFLAFS